MYNVTRPWIRHTSHVTRYLRHTSHVTCHTSNVTHHTSNVKRYWSHFIRHTILNTEIILKAPSAMCFSSSKAKLDAMWECKAFSALFFFMAHCCSNCVRWVMHLQAWVSCIHQALKEMKVTVLRVTSFGVDLFHLLSSLLLLSCNIVHSLLTPNFKRIDYSYPKNRRWPRGKKMKKNRGN